MDEDVLEALRRAWRADIDSVPLPELVPLEQALQIVADTHTATSTE